VGLTGVFDAETLADRSSGWGECIARRMLDLRAVAQDRVGSLMKLGNVANLTATNQMQLYGQTGRASRDAGELDTLK
jgi:hypothetical protein